MDEERTKEELQKLEDSIKLELSKLNNNDDDCDDALSKIMYDVLLFSKIAYTLNDGILHLATLDYFKKVKGELIETIP